MSISHLLSFVTPGNIACVLQMILIFDGMSDQIKLNWQRKSAEGLSVRKQYWTLFACIAWVITGIHGGNYYLALPQAPCIFFTVWTIGQIHYYSRAEK